jgi:hypothetical protein
MAEKTKQPGKAAKAPMVVGGGNALTTADPQFLALSPARQQEVISAELFGTAEKMDYKYSDYGKKCALNGIVAAQVYLRGVGKEFKDINIPLFILSLHNLAVTELNCATIPSEAFCDMRGDVLAFKPQGVGNERLVRKFGVGIKPETGLHKCWVIRDGDEFTLPQFDGLEVVPPKWTPKSLSGKVKMVVYPVEKANGDVEWLMADRASVIQNVVAQCRQNALYAFTKKDDNGNPIDKWGNLAWPKGKYKAATDTKARDAYYERLNQLAEEANGDLDKFLANPEVKKYINPTYTSFGSKEAMILRKMQNNALKQYPKDYESSIVAKAISDMNEDLDESLDERNAIDNHEDVIEKVEKETKALPQGEKVPDFEVNEETGEISEPAKEEPTSATKQAEEATSAKPAQDDYEDLV